MFSSVKGIASVILLLNKTHPCVRVLRTYMYNYTCAFVVKTYCTSCVQPSPIPWFVPRKLTPLAAAKTAMTFQLYGCFVCVDDVIEAARCFMEEIVGELQPLDLVGCSDQLAVSTAAESPAEFPATAQNCREG